MRHRVRSAVPLLPLLRRPVNQLPPRSGCSPDVWRSPRLTKSALLSGRFVSCAPDSAAAAAHTPLSGNRAHACIARVRAPDDHPGMSQPVSSPPAAVRVRAAPMAGVGATPRLHGAATPSAGPSGAAAAAVARTPEQLDRIKLDGQQAAQRASERKSDADGLAASSVRRADAALISLLLVLAGRFSQVASAASCPSRSRTPRRPRSSSARTSSRSPRARTPSG